MSHELQGKQKTGFVEPDIEAFAEGLSTHYEVPMISTKSKKQKYKEAKAAKATNTASKSANPIPFRRSAVAQQNRIESAGGATPMDAPNKEITK
ncbi:MAG: hypothetical protein Q9168_003620 [Polycauliona sp. 1 TL-2023]